MNKTLTYKVPSQAQFFAEDRAYDVCADSLGMRGGSTKTGYCWVLV